VVKLPITGAIMGSGAVKDTGAGVLGGDADGGSMQIRRPIILRRLTSFNCLITLGQSSDSEAFLIDGDA